MDELVIIGGGLSGCEAAWQAAQQGIKVQLFEMRPHVETGAHQTSHLAELVCSNSLGSDLADRASGLLKMELKKFHSLLIDCAEKTSVPAGGALAVDRDAFSSLVTLKLGNHPNIKITREEYQSIPSSPAIIASGPLTSNSLAIAIQILTGQGNLFFFDAISPIVLAETVDMDIAFRSSRYQRGISEVGDYLNCPFTKEEYENFVDALIHAERIEIKDFELEIEKGVKAGIHNYFEGCLPVEILAMRGKNALAYGPMRPVGLENPKNNSRPFAVLQLRQDNLARSLYNLVGFQTNLLYREQIRVFRMIPGLAGAEFSRYGQMHRNTFIFSPGSLTPDLQSRHQAGLFFAGQITGVEGYAGNIGTGLLAGINAARFINGESLITLPETTMLGALCHYITHASQKDFQPMKANFGILPPLKGEYFKDKRIRAKKYSERALSDLDTITQLRRRVSERK